jgi:hypothetical protein
MKITNTITGYPDADSYVIDLKKSFNNVTNIHLISTEFPYIDILIQKNINDKFKVGFRGRYNLEAGL